MNACNKKIIKFNGGLGNQMFQYAFACALQDKFNCDIYFDYSFFEDVKHCDFVANREYELELFKVNCPECKKEDLDKIKQPKRFFEKRFPKLFGINYKREKNNWIYDKNLIKPYFCYYEGYFQHAKYFAHLKDKLIQDFTLRDAINEENSKILNEIKKTNSVSLHIRRGDYVAVEGVKQIHGTCSMDYYKKAIEYIAKHVNNPHFYLFSDDIQWVLDNIKLNYQYTIVDLNQGKGFYDLELMKNCKNNIIANSSFSWWGAWLNQNPNKIIIAPRNWTAQKVKCNIVPKEWIKIR